MRITIETTPQASQRFVKPTGLEVCALIEMVREMLRYNMGPEPAYSSTGPVFANDGTMLAQWKLEL